MAKRHKPSGAGTSGPPVPDGLSGPHERGPATGPARTWPGAEQHAAATKKMQARRQLPSGPLGGSGRKTNVSRSS